MFYAYLIKSENFPEQRYIGLTDDLKKRLSDHNKGLSIHTNKFKPWRIKNYFAFGGKEKAENFEIFLKSGNGRIFCKKHF